MAVSPVVAVEIGTSKVVVLVGEVREDGHIVVVGKGEQPSAGVRKGEVTDVDHAVACVRAALGAAEENAQVTIHQVHLALSGRHFEATPNRGVIPVHSADHVVTEEDVEEVTDVARAVNLSPDERKVLHSIGQIFYVDRERVGNPVGFEGGHLALDMLILHAKMSQVRTSVRLLRKLQQDVADIAFSGLCSALAVVTPEQKEGGVLVIDLGGGTTTYVAYAAGTFAAAGALGLGGDHVTNDITLAFSIPRSQAERLKKEAGGAVTDEATRNARVNLPPEVGYPGRTVSMTALQTVIHLRMSEIFNLVLRDMERHGIQHQIGAGVILTGGGARMKGILELAQRTFRAPCAIGVPIGFIGRPQTIEDPEYSTAAGLLRYAARAAAGQRRPSMLNGLLGMFKSTGGRKS